MACANADFWINGHHLGKTVQTSESNLRLAGNETRSVEQLIEVRSPKLWSPDSPELYSAKIEMWLPHEGRGLAILRPKDGSGKITLNAEADRLKPATIVVRTH